MANASIISKDSVAVWHDKVPKPVHVRLAWHRNPIHNLYNMEKLPAVPFRMDDIDLMKSDAADKPEREPTPRTRRS
jgi:hypothetical protein